MSPTRVAKLCTTPGCPHPATYRGKCDDHKRERERVRNQRQESRAIYQSAQWKRLRTLILSAHPQCEWYMNDGDRLMLCPRDATDVDHIVPIEEGGAPWDEENLQALCHSHHSSKTAKENGFGGLNQSGG